MFSFSHSQEKEEKVIEDFTNTWATGCSNYDDLIQVENTESYVSKAQKIQERSCCSMPNLLIEE